MKAIALIRTSTIKQEVESQKEEVIQFAKEDGFRDEDIIIVGGAGASAIKLDLQYQENINEVYSLINQGKIGCVYAFAIDRIGRNEEVLMRFKNTLIEHRVNLKIKNPSLCLLNPDSSVNGGVELAFTLFATLAKQEMEQKKARFKRAKKRNKAEGRFNGGKVLFGYAVDDTGHFILHATNAGVVKKIFSKYANTTDSIKTIAKQLINDGVLTSSLSAATHHVNMIVRNRNYLGEGAYPQIVSESLFESAQEKLKEYRIHPRVRYESNVYYCQGLLKEMVLNPAQQAEIEAGREIRAPIYIYHHMRVKKSEVSYVSKTERLSLNINTFDSAIIQILNHRLKSLSMSSIVRAIDDRRTQYQNEINKLKRDIDTIAKKEEKLIEDYYTNIEKNIGKDQFDRFSKRLADDKAVKEKMIKDFSNKLVELEETKIESVNLYELSDEVRKDIIQKNISNIYVEKTENKFITEILIRFKMAMRSERFFYNRKDKTIERLVAGNRRVSTPIRIIRNIKGRKRVYRNGKRTAQLLDEQG